MFSQSLESMININYIPPLGDFKFAKIVELFKKSNSYEQIPKFEQCLQE